MARAAPLPTRPLPCPSLPQCWAATPAATWHVLLPLLLVESMPMLVQRVRFVKTLLWAMPERGHQVGGGHGGRDGDRATVELCASRCARW